MPPSFSLRVWDSVLVQRFDEEAPGSTLFTEPEHENSASIQRVRCPVPGVEGLLPCFLPSGSSRPAATMWRMITL
jgi:hypothetical protein